MTARGAARRLRTDGAAAVMLLTRLPAGWMLGPGAAAGGAPDLARSLWAWPALGALLGAGGGAVVGLARWLGMPPALAAVWALAALAAVTGALHEDGLADAADGLLGGGTRERRLEIMRDSRIGTYGALALLLSLGLRGTALAALAALPGLGAASCALAASGALGRACMAGLLLTLPPARPDGLAATLGRARWGSPGAGMAGAAIVLGAGLALALLPAGAALASIVVAGLGAAAVGRIAWRRIGGHSGDVLGAAEIAAECAVLSVAAAALAG